MSYIFNTFFYNPLYNALVYLIDIIPGGDVGIGVILLTLVVSFLLFSISKNAIRSQMKLKEIEPELALIKQNPDKQEQAKLMIALYQKHHINPFSMILLLILQIPILFALYYVFYRGGLPQIHTEILYSFIKVPAQVNMNFLGILDISQKSWVVALIAGITQFIQAKLVAPATLPKTEGKGSLSQDFARSMQMQMKYTFPAIIFFIGLGFPSALPLYWSTRNLFTIGQELILRKKRNKDKEVGKII